MLRLFNIRISAVLTAIAFLAGCSEDAIREDLSKGPESAENVYIRFRIDLNGSGTPDGGRSVSRAGNDGIFGSPREHAIETIDLLVFSADPGRGELIDTVSLGRDQIKGPGNPNTFTVPLFVKKGQQVRICAAVNMPDRIRRQFVIGRTRDDISFAAESADYWTAIDEIVPGSNGRQSTFEKSGNGIPMTGRFKTDGDSEVIRIAEENLTPDNPLNLTARIDRIVAKIHVLATTRTFDFTTVEYVNAEDKSSKDSSGETDAFAKWMGWIRLADVRYMPNGTNRSTYLFPQLNPEGNRLSPYKDLNMNLSSYLMGEQDFDIGFDAPMWIRDYVFYNGLSLHRENISAESHLAQVEAFDRNKFNNTANNGSGDRYIEGMYCLENYFDSPGTPDPFTGYSDVIPMVTHVSIAAKLTPRRIVVLEDYRKRMDDFVKWYQDNPDDFRKETGLRIEDFTDEDVKRWEAIKEYYDNGKDKSYFSGTENLYRDVYRIIRTDKETDAADIINWSLKVNGLWTRDAADFESGQYPDGTFYVYDTKEYDGGQAAHDNVEWNQQYLYLTAGAVANATGTNADLKTYSVPHLGGWGYYYTYLDQLAQTSDGKTPYTSSQVTRNTYYLVTVGNFGTPGGTITRPEYIKVNTEPVGWDYTGKGDINLH